MNEPFKALARAAQTCCAPPHCLIYRALGFRAAHRALPGELVVLAIGALFIAVREANDLWNAVPGALYDHEIADTGRLSDDFLLVMNGGVLDHLSHNRYSTPYRAGGTNSPRTS